MEPEEAVPEHPVETVLATVRGHIEDFLGHLPQIAVALVVLALTWLVARGVDALLRRSFARARVREALGELLRRLAYIGVWTAGLLVAAIVVFPNLTPASALAALGLGSIAIGFAFKDIFENFLAGVLILLREPFRLHDFIECNGFEGYIEDINIRDVNIRQVDGQRVVIPNAVLFQNPVVVRTDQERRRVTITCGVAYGEDVDRAREVIRRAVEGLRTVDGERSVQIFAQAFGESSIDFEVTWWTGSKPLEIRVSKDEVVAAVKRALDEAGIEIPFPYRTLTFKEPLRTVLGRAGEGAGAAEHEPRPGAAEGQRAAAAQSRRGGPASLLQRAFRR